MIRFYGETATVVMSDEAVCELSFKPDLEDRQVVIDDRIVITTRVNEGNIKTTDHILTDTNEHYFYQDTKNLSLMVKSTNLKLGHQQENYGLMANGLSATSTTELVSGLAVACVMCF